MVIHSPTNSLILKLRNPAEVTSLIPRSRVVEYDGQAFTQVHFGFEEVRVLRNLGIAAPSPIRLGYDWPRNARVIKQPMAHQILTAEALTLNRRFACLNDMGTGKTMSALWAADFLMRCGVVRKAIIVAPLSTIHETWGDSIRKHFLMHRKVIILHNASADRRRKLLQEDADFYVVNHDGLGMLANDLKERPDINLWIYDEAAKLRNATTDRYKLFKSLVRGTDWLWLMTGTPIPTAPTDAWALAKLIGSATVPKYFNTFREQVMLKLNDYKWVPRAGATQAAYDILQPAIRFRKQDCIDLPPVVFQYRTCSLTAEQTRAFADMQKRLVTTVGEQQITAANAAVKLTKLLQVVTGAIYDETGVTHVLDASPRLALVEEICENAARKVIVFVPYKSALKQVAEHLAKRWSVVTVSGDTSATQRSKIFDDFQNQEDPRILVAHPDTTAHGLTLTAADTTIWYAPIFSLETFEQANNRTDRPGQTHNMTVAMIAATALEMEIYKMLESRGNLQQQLLELYRRGVSAC